MNAEQEDPAQRVAQAAKDSVFRQVAGEDFSVREAVGGPRGLVESIAPGLVFVVVFLLTRDLMPPLVASLAVAAVLMVVRLVTRSPLTQAAGGLVGVGVGALWAWRTGEAEDFFVLGIWVNVAYFAAVLVSVLLRWPIVGVIVSLLRSEGFSWRGPELRARRRRYTAATWVWVAVFGLRLAVQVPLYLHAEVAWLGTARLVMGLPLWALALWLTWLLVRESPARASAAAR